MQRLVVDHPAENDPIQQFIQTAQREVKKLIKKRERERKKGYKVGVEGKGRCGSSLSEYEHST